MTIKQKDELKIQIADVLNKLSDSRNALLWVLDKLDKED